MDVGVSGIKLHFVFRKELEEIAFGWKNEGLKELLTCFGIDLIAPLAMTISMMGSLKIIFYSSLPIFTCENKIFLQSVNYLEIAKKNV